MIRENLQAVSGDDQRGEEQCEPGETQAQVV
jgi:hypothetical protein